MVGQVELAQAPQHFLHIDRIGPAPDRQLALIAVRHAFLLPCRFGPVIAKKTQKSASSSAEKNRPRHVGGAWFRRGIAFSGRRTATAKGLSGSARRSARAE